MAATKDSMSGADTTDGISAVASTVSQGHDITTATMIIITKRLALGLAAALDPIHADHVSCACDSGKGAGIFGRRHGVGEPIA